MTKYRNFTGFKTVMNVDTGGIEMHAWKCELHVAAQVVAAHWQGVSKMDDPSMEWHIEGSIEMKEDGEWHSIFVAGRECMTVQLDAVLEDIRRKTNEAARRADKAIREANIRKWNAEKEGK